MDKLKTSRNLVSKDWMRGDEGKCISPSLSHSGLLFYFPIPDLSSVLSQSPDCLSLSRITSFLWDQCKVKWIRRRCGANVLVVRSQDAAGVLCRNATDLTDRKRQRWMMATDIMREEQIKNQVRGKKMRRK